MTTAAPKARERFTIAHRVQHNLEALNFLVKEHVQRQVQPANASQPGLHILLFAHKQQGKRHKPGTPREPTAHKDNAGYTTKLRTSRYGAGSRFRMSAAMPATTSSIERASPGSSCRGCVSISALNMLAH